MSDWVPFLLGNVLRAEYDLVTGRPDDDGLNRILSSIEIASVCGSWLVGKTTNRVFFGVCDWIKMYWGPDHPDAADRSGRPLGFALIYQAPLKSKLPPGRQRLELMQSHIRPDLERIWGLVRERRRALQVPLDFPPTRFPDFKRQPGSDAWDEAVGRVVKTKGDLLLKVNHDCIDELRLPTPLSILGDSHELRSRRPLKAKLTALTSPSHPGVRGDWVTAKPQQHHQQQKNQSQADDRIGTSKKFALPSKLFGCFQDLIDKAWK